jgi:NifU-like protein involved in Fe-S cluster formation
MQKSKKPSQNNSLLQLVRASDSFRHRGLIVKPEVSLLGINEACGDKIVLQLQIAKKKVSQARFTGESCSLSALGAETMCRLIEETKTLGPISEKEFLHSLNFKFSPLRKKCAYLIWKTWENYVAQKQTKKNRIAKKK